MLSCIIAGVEGDSNPMFCLCSFTLLPFGNSKSSFTFPPAARRRARIGLVGILILFAGFLLTGRAAAQSACAQLGVDCSHHDTNRPTADSSEPRSDPIAVWKERWAAGAEARKQH